MNSVVLKRDDLTPEQVAAISKWWDVNDPNGYTYEYVDNERYAVKGNVEQETGYDYMRMGGCCGFMDTEIEVGSSTLLFGFNYGH